MSYAESFYEKGLRFQCTRCSGCCRHTPGYVFLSHRDVDMLTRSLGITRDELVTRYCRPVELGVARRISLLEKPNLDCIFWEGGGCAVYEARPLQCRSFPFWSSSVSSKDQWEEVGSRCPGVGRGRLHRKREIQRWLARRRAEGFIEG